MCWESGVEGALACCLRLRAVTQRHWCRLIFSPSSSVNPIHAAAIGLGCAVNEGLCSGSVPGLWDCCWPGSCSSGPCP